MALQWNIREVAQIQPSPRAPSSHLKKIRSGLAPWTGFGRWRKYTMASSPPSTASLWQEAQPEEYKFITKVHEVSISGKNFWG